MPGSRFLALDIGTSSVKCLVVDSEGRCDAVVSRMWTTYRPANAPEIAREFSPGRLVRLIGRVVREALGTAGVNAGDVAAVGLTSQRQGIVALDENGREVYAGPNMDLRAVFEGSAMDETHGHSIYDTTGHLPSFFFTPAKLKWFQLNLPRRFLRFHTVLPLADWVAYRLTGNIGCEPSLAGEMGLLDISSGDWCIPLQRELGVELPSYAPLRPAGAIAGIVTSEASDEIDLPAGTPVAVGGADTQCGLLGMGVTDEGDAGLVAGWSAPLQQVTGTPVFSPTMATWTGLNVVPGRWVLESSAGVAGYALDWTLRAFGGRVSAAGLKRLEARMRDVPPGSDGVAAFMGASRMDMASVGYRLGGILMPVPATHYGISRGHLARAVLENVAFAVRANLEQIEGITGHRAGRICAGGGMSSNDVFVQMMADVLGRAIFRARLPHMSGLGAAMAAATAAGAYGTLAEASDAMRGDLVRVEPDHRVSAEYRDHYERWRELSARLEDMPL